MTADAGSLSAAAPVADLPPDALIIVPVRNIVLFPGRRAAGRGRPAALDRRRAAGRARAAPDRHPHAARRRSRRTRRPSICTASARSPTSCATSPRPDGTHHLICQGEQRFRVVRVPRASGRSSPRARCRIPSPRRRSRRSRRASCICKARRSRRCSFCRRRRRSLSPPSNRRHRPGRSPISPRPTWTSTPDEKQEILETIDLVARMDKVSRLLAERIEVLRLSQEIGRQTKAALDERQREVLLREQMAAIQRQLGEARRQGAGDGRARRGDRQGRRCRRRSRSRRARNCAATSACRKRPPKRGMVRTYLDWLIELPWALPRGDADRHRGGAAHPRRGPLRPRKDQAADRRISGGAQARAAGQGADPVLRRPAGRRQDLARPIDRPRHGPQIRARQPRRRARRGGDPRPPAHLYRRAARQHHPGDPQGAARATA